jgi:hypothetical protein
MPNKPTIITKPLLQALRADVDAALVAVAEKYGVILRCGNGSFADTTAHLKLEVAIGAPGESPALVKARESWRILCVAYGLKAEWLGRTFARTGDRFTVVGLEPKRQKFPVLCRREGDGKMILLAAEDVRLRLNSADQVGRNQAERGVVSAPVRD